MSSHKVCSFILSDTALSVLLPPPTPETQPLSLNGLDPTCASEFPAQPGLLNIQLPRLDHSDYEAQGTGCTDRCI